MRFLCVRAVVSSLCLFVGVYSLSAQQATVNHGVSLRGDPSTKNPPIGHLDRNSTLTLLAVTPEAGFYHVKTSDGTEGWVASKYVTVEEQPGNQPAGGSTTPTTGSTGCDSTLWKHVYHKSRLAVIQACTTVSGTVHVVGPEPDGDVHIQLKLDPQFSSMLNAVNKRKQRNALVIEPMCDHTPTQPDAISSCQGFTQKFPALNEGAHVKVAGSYVEDRDPNHGWREIHPITAVEVVP